MLWVRNLTTITGHLQQFIHRQCIFNQRRFHTHPISCITSHLSEMKNALSYTCPTSSVKSSTFRSYTFPSNVLCDINGSLKLNEIVNHNDTAANARLVKGFNAI